ncbi:hypothetical protein [Demequina maris]|uniref:hypothetical protein n=1 Tax=Demequina maris TaxID=1638982 RepID=UPI0007854723|nr:hypothetical protein [Demequina maris]
MSARLAAELGREEDRGRSIDADVITGIEGRALARLARARTMRRGLVVGGSAVVLGIAAWAISSTSDPSTLAAPSSAVTTPQPDVSVVTEDGPLTPMATGDLSAEALIAGSAPRIRGEEPETPRQAALLCQMDPDNNPWHDAAATVSTLTETRECEAVWVGDGLILAPDFTYARLLTRVDDDGATVVLDWLLQGTDNLSESPLVIDDAALAATLATDPDTVSGPGLRTRGAYVGESMWTSDDRRLAVMGNASHPRALTADFSAVLGGVELTTQPPGSSLHSDELWAIASGEVTPAAVLQVRIVPERDAGDQELILEVELDPDNRMWGEEDAVAGVPAEDLLAGAVPRSRDEARAGRQAASVCELPEALQSGATYLDIDFSAEWAALECDPVWLEHPVFEATPAGDDGSGASEQDGYVQWNLTNVSRDAVRATNAMLLVETRPAGDASTADLTLFDAVAVAPSGWTADGRRLVPMSNLHSGVFTQHVQAANYFGGGALVDSSSRTLGPERPTHPVLKALRKGTATTGLVLVPFSDDPTRVLALEVPMGDTVAVGSS